MGTRRGARRTYAYVATPRERANPPAADRRAFFSSLLARSIDLQAQQIVIQLLPLLLLGRPLCLDLFAEPFDLRLLLVGLGDENRYRTPIGS
jgi:hypothetical protein